MPDLESAMTSPYPIAAIAGILMVALSLAALLIWVERRLLALWQDRYGPNRVGPFGLLQPLADSIKLFTKEDWIPPFADKPVFVIAPAVIVATSLISFAVIPFSPGFVIADLNLGLLFLLAMSSLGVYSVVLAGWSSNNKYSLLGGLRAAAQMLSYEVFMGLSVMGVVVMTGSFRLTDIVEAQQRLWFVVPQFLGFVLFLIAGVAETRRLPFDLAEAESELIAGFHSEYSGMKFGMFFVGEYIGVVLISSVITLLYFGGWLGPFLPPVWFAIKIFFFIGLFILFRASLPRPRFDQLMSWGWKTMLPLALLNLLVTGAGRVACDEEVVRDVQSKLRSLCGVYQNDLEVFLHSFHRRVTVQYPEEKPYLAPRYRAAYHSDARPRWRRTMRCVLFVRRCLPRRLHRAAGHRRRKRAPLSRVLPHQLLPLHFLRLLRRGMSHLRYPAHARF